MVDLPSELRPEQRPSRVAIRCRGSVVGPSLDPQFQSVPSWGELPTGRRRRLVAVLGVLVLRRRGEEATDERRSVE